MTVEELIANIDPHDPGFEEEGSIEAVMSALREQCPVAHTQAHGGAYVVTRYDDVLAVAQNWEAFSSASGIMIPRAANASDMIPGESDPPLHRSFRRALNPLLAPNAVQKYQAGMRLVARELLRPALDRTEVDLVPAFTDPYPRIVFFRHVVGVPESEIDEVYAYLLAIKEPKSLESASVAWTDLGDYIRMVCDRRQGSDRRGDLLDGVLGATVDGRRITQDEAVRALMQLTFGGLGTTTAALANMIRRLGENADLQRRVRAEGASLARFIEELLRFDTVTIWVARTTTREVALGGTSVPANEKVLMYFAGANRDARQFDKADEIDIDRPVNRHLGFGAGPHRCIGSHLARLQIRVALEEMLAHLADIRLVPGYRSHFHSGLSRGLTTLPIRYRPLLPR